MTRLLTLISLMLLSSCQTEKGAALNNYGDDLSFLKKHDPTLLELKDSKGNARVILSGRYQGRVMTSTSDGLSGKSFGWINRNLISSRRINPQFNPVGGEERFWLGPEGGQFSLYFAAGDSFKIKNWQVPALIDTMPWTMTSQTDTSATFNVQGQIVNYSGTTFDLKIKRTVELLRRDELAGELNATIMDRDKFVAYRSTNTLTNAGTFSWARENGLISVWLLGMLTPSELATVIIPLPERAEKSMINTNYFGEIPPDRLSITGSTLLFKCDGKYRSKIGLPPGIANSKIGSYDDERKILTIVSLQIDKKADYVNSKWELQNEPFKGDAVNAYNDGLLADGSQLGPFYELESSSPAIALKPGESMSYSQVTSHFEGDFETLNRIATTVLRFDLNDLKKRQ